MGKLATLTFATLGILAIAVSGCATGGKGPTPEEAIKAQLEAFKLGMESKDVTKLDPAISANFKHYEWGDKAGLIGFLDSTMKDGSLDNAEIDLEFVEIAVEGETATAYPVELAASFGSATIKFTFAHEADGQWRATEVDVQGI
ncbi:MAG: hypothetical protein AMXMBFR84_29450 [Candidatus Hydrogenedentota bacterium]